MRPHPVLSDHKVLVWLAPAADLGLGAIVIAHGWPVLDSSRRQHGVPQAKELVDVGCITG